MDSVLRNVANLSADERRVYESVFGRPLHDNQSVIVQLIMAEAEKAVPPMTSGVIDVLEPYAIWAQFSDEEIAELESAILDRSESRPT